MNILTDDLPVSVEIAGRVYPINYDFKTCLTIILAFEDNELTPQEKQIVLLSNLFKSLPADISQALEQASLFLNGGEPQEVEESPYRLYSFSNDGNYIYAAFKQTHGLDLAAESLHWWKFLALFMDLGQDTTFCQLVALRKRLKTGKATKEERTAAREMGIEIPELDTRTLEEKEAAALFEQKVEEARKRRELENGT